MRFTTITAVLMMSAILVGGVMHGCDARATPPLPTAKTDAADPFAAVNAEYHAVLADIVDEEGLIRYRMLEDPARQQRLQSVIDGYAQATLPTEQRHRMAFQCNAYNANALAMAWGASRGPGFRSVKEVPGFFAEKTITVAGQAVTLDALASEIRKHGDARVHAALVCGARSSPPFRAEPYRGATLDKQLNDQSLRWVEDNTKNRVGQRSIAISQIFEWFEEDFKADPYGGALGFIKEHGRPRGQMRDFINSVKTFDIHYLPYNWGLNRSIFDEGTPSQP